MNLSIQENTNHCCTKRALRLGYTRQLSVAVMKQAEQGRMDVMVKEERQLLVVVK